MLNRAVLILKYKAPFIDWIKEADPYEENLGISADETNKESTAYLIRNEDAEHLERWLKKNFRELFERELFDWYVDESLWPKKRTFHVFKEWFEVDCYSVVIDTVGGRIFDDKAE